MIQLLRATRRDSSRIVACPFCSRILIAESLIAANASAAAFADGFPVAEGHVLVVPRVHVARLELLPASEWAGVFALVQEIAQTIADEGVNIGVNSGAAAGQTVDHAHVHVIPRRAGDVADPRGGVRWVIPTKADYWTDRA